jgi:hypothetical protein
MGFGLTLWKEEILRRIEMGELLFSRDQASLMRTRIRGAEMTLVRVEVKYGKVD